VIQIQIPSEPPASFFSSSEDGPGWAVVMFFKITEVFCNCLVYFISLQFNCVFLVHLVFFSPEGCVPTVKRSRHGESSSEIIRQLV
jgi:hypothetical protein